MLPPDVDGLLKRSATFAHLDDSARETLRRELVWFGLPGGRPLFKHGEAADALYLLKNGSLGVFDSPTVLRHLIGAGESVGEIGLVDGVHRQRTVRALRDCELLRLDRAAFERVLARHPQALLGVARMAIDRLQRRERGEESAGLPRTFALIPASDGVPARMLAMRLMIALEKYGSCVVIDAELGAGRSADWFAEREAQAHFVIYLDVSRYSGADRHLWRERCLRQADVLLLPAMAAQPVRAWPDMQPDRPLRVRHRPRHLILLHAGHQVALGAAQRWRDVFHGELQHHHLCSDADIPRLARSISGNARGLILAGGGARGLAHLGVLRALHEAGHRFDAVGGTSIGAIIGAGVAAGWGVDEMTDTFRHAFVRGRPLSDWTLPLVALTRGGRAARMLHRTFGALEIEDLPLPYFCVSTRLSGGGQAVHRHGPLWHWLRASSAIPGVLPPLLHRGQVHVDGALVNNLPTDVMTADGIAHITALDIRADIALHTDAEESATPSLWRLWLQRGVVQRPGLLSTLVRAGMVNGEEASLRRRDLAQLLFTPPLEHVGMLDWKDWQRAIDAGYRHAVELLESAADVDGSIEPARSPLA
ncbi:patatin-like phospholipase family protein [Rhodanobacter sp. L36]|uniref:patatin-like phospholipase family protein n=1 Tax=Rhodanobacter sp. L36 TaxID=1747221 RepID=UPI00131C0E1C|nr:patatin-like phospholipase family protein [Rhodanobacter sp. L36]